MGLRAKLFLPLLLAVSLFAAYVYLLWVPRSLADAESTYQGSVTRHLESVAEGLIPLLLGSQLDAVYGNLDALLAKNADWVSIQLLDPEGRSLYPLHPSGIAKGVATHNIRMLTQDIRYLDLKLGTLEVKVDFTPRLAEIERRSSLLLYLFLGVMLVFLLPAGLVLDYQVRKPIKLLADASGRLAKGDFRMRLPRPDGGEVGTLVTSFAGMRDAIREANETLEQRVQERTRELHAAQSELLATARQAGMAEIATNVLHNVGNVLNSVNVSVSLVSSQVRDSRAAGLARAAHLMNEHAADIGDFLTHDERGKRLPEYLNKLAEALAAEQAGILEELGQLSRSVDHIKDIVVTQQSYAGTSRLIEPVDVRNVVDDALRMNAGALTRHDVSVVKEFAEVPTLPLDRHRVLQILVNLISNAKYAMDAIDATPGRPHRMTLRVALVDGAAGRSLQICVADEGEGIPAANLERIFIHGFTTRKNGHGFGLHSCALAAHEMGGTLTAHSAGPGQGATFTLALPITAAVGA